MYLKEERPKMCSPLMSILLVGILCVTASHAAGSYAVICPKSIRPGQNFKCTVSISGAAISTMDASLANGRGEDFPNTKKTLTNIGNGEAKEFELTNVPADLKVNDVKLKVEMTIGGTKVKNETNLEIERKSMSIFIQSDKAKYKPKDTLKFRVFATDADLMPVLKPLDIVLKDPKNDVFQWLNVSGKADKNGVLSLEYIVPELAELGDWSINVKSGDNSEIKKFAVEKYVLPRFEVNINKVSSTGPATSFILSGTKSNQIEVSAKYTFGENVNGVAHVTIGHETGRGGQWYDSNTKIKEEQFKETLLDGKVTLKVDVASGINHLAIFAEVVESSTGEKLNNSKEIKVFEFPCELKKMELTPTIFQQGLAYHGYFQLQSSDGTTYPDNVDIAIHYIPCPSNEFGSYDCYSSSNTKYQVSEPKKVDRGSDGIIPFNFDTKPEFVAYKVVATASCTKQDVSYQINKFETQNKDLGLSLKLSSDYNAIKVGAIASFKLCSKSTFNHFNLVVFSKGTIVYQKDNQITLSTCYLFDVLISQSMAPSAKFFVTYIGGSDKSPEMVADYLELTIDGSMANTVSVKFNKPQAELGDQVSVNVNAAPTSYVGLLCVDKSVLLLATGNDITQDDAVEEQRSYGKKKDNNNNGGIIPFFFWRCGPISSRSGSTMQMIGDLNLVVMTAAHIEGHYSSYGGGGRMFVQFAVAGVERGPIMRKAGGGKTNAPIQPKPRVEFPETWIWADSLASANGMASFPATVPDTITTWECSAFALDMKKGLGIAPDRAKLIAKKEFFVQLLMPYSIKNQESFILKVLVHQYTGNPLNNVQVKLLASTKLETSDDFSAKAAFKANQPLIKYIKKMTGSTEMVAFHIHAPRVGDVKIHVEAQDGARTVSDAIEKDLRVEPTGVLRIVPITFLVGLKNGDPAWTKKVPISVPSDGIVSGSEKVEVAVIGDIMGPSLKNMDGMLQMPYGCGEQNMINFAPAMFIYRYLESTNSLTAESKDKALKVMESGYTRELTFFHTCCDKGSVSAFGDRCGTGTSCKDQEGSTWLTAFVMKSFGQAAKYITISETGIYQGVDWLLSMQQADGSFQLRGRVIHNDFQGGSAKGIALDAYILISMMEYPEGFKDRQQIVKTKLKVTASHLEKYARDLMGKLATKKPTDTELYDLTIIAYALALMDNMYADTILNKLDTLASNMDGEKYWKMSSATKCDSPYRCYDVKPNPSEVEIASYALLAYLKRSKCSQNAGCSSISKWMAKQRGAKGGFCSTKDTVLGIQAISAFAQQQSQVPPNFSAQFSYASQSANFGVSKLDSKILQEKLLYYQPNQPVNIRVNGTGSGIAQVNYRYNEVTITKYTDKLDIDKDVTCSKLVTGEQTCTIKLCISQQDDLIKGMSILESSCLSGFEPYGEVTCDGCSTMKLNRYEVDEAKFVSYLNFVSSSKQCLKMTCIQKQVVTHFQPAVIAFADYYSTDVRKEVMYSAPQSLVAQDSCKECGAACGCPQGPLKGNTAVDTTPMILLTICMLVLARMMK